jgi:hemolysin activation/secretion protein
MKMPMAGMVVKKLFERIDFSGFFSARGFVPVVVCVFLLSNSVFASAADAEEPITFAINHFEVEGNSILDPATIKTILAPFEGDNKSFATVQQALEALEQAYANIGFSTVLVTLPEQKLEGGTVHFKVVEGQVSKIVVDEKKYFDEQNALHSLPTIRIGETPNIDKLAANLSMIGDNPAKRTNVVFKPGEEEGDVIANVKTSEQNPVRYVTTLDNTGTWKTGILRVGFAVQNANMFDRDQVLTVQAITSPQIHHADDVQIFAASYHIPFYEQNTSLDAIFGYSSVDSGNVNTSVGDFSINGSGLVYELHYNWYLPKWGNWEQKFSTGFSYRVFKTNVSLVNSSGTLVPPLDVHPIDFTYSGFERNDRYNVSGYFSLVQNLPFGPNGRTSDFDQIGARPGSRASYMLARYGIDYSYLFKSGWQGRVKFNGQYTRDQLIPGEQFGFGGQDSVRGLNERAFSNDRGGQVSFEAYTPEFGAHINEQTRMRALVFWDSGKVIRNHPDVFERRGDSMSSVGVGIRGAYTEDINYRLDAGYIPNNHNLVAGHTRLNGQIAWSF